jgi:hypothetical protein
LLVNDGGNVTLTYKLLLLMQLTSKLRKNNIMQSNQTINDFLIQQENITPFVTKIYQCIGQEVRSQDKEHVLLAVQSSLPTLRKSWVVCPNNAERYASIFFYYIDSKIWWPFEAEGPVLSIYHRVGCWPSESALLICGTNPRAFAEITDDFFAEVKNNLDVEIGEFIDHSGEEWEPYEKGDGVALKEFHRFPLTDNINLKIIRRKIVKLGR